MNDKTLQDQLDQPNGPLFKNNSYHQPLRHREPTPKWKSHGRNGRNFETKKTRS